MAVAVNDAGELLIDDTDDSRIREVDGGPATAALITPQGATLGADAHSPSECYWSCTSAAQDDMPVDPSTGDYSVTATDVEPARGRGAPGLHPHL